MTQTTNSERLVFVYGTLKSGGRLNQVMIRCGASCVGAARILSKDYIMRNLGTYPALQQVEPGSGNYIIGELWLVPTDAIRVLDEVEGCPNFYQRADVTVWSGETPLKAIAYHVPFKGGDRSWLVQCPVIQSGEWDQFGNCPAMNNGNPTRPDPVYSNSCNTDDYMTDDVDDCSECGYWLIDGQCTQCGYIRADDVPFDVIDSEDCDDSNEESEGDDETTSLSAADFTVENGVFITSEWGDMYGPYDSIKEALANIGEVAEEFGEDLRCFTIGFRIYRSDLTNEELIDLDEATQPA